MKMEDILYDIEAGELLMCTFDVINHTVSMEIRTFPEENVTKDYSIRMTGVTSLTFLDPKQEVEPWEHAFVDGIGARWGKVKIRTKIIAPRSAKWLVKKAWKVYVEIYFADLDIICERIIVNGQEITE